MNVLITSTRKFLLMALIFFNVQLMHERSVISLHSLGNQEAAAVTLCCQLDNFIARFSDFSDPLSEL